MRNFTLSQSKFFRLISLVLLLFITSQTRAQFYTQHFIAPAPWQYFSKANEVVIATDSPSTVNITLKRSDGTVEANLTAKKGEPAIYRFKAFAATLPLNPLNKVLNGAGLIIESTLPTSVNVRNIASDDYKDNENADANIKGNAALTSFGNAGVGIRFRVGYYRDGSLGNFGSFGEQRPIYSIMATVSNTSIKINDKVVTTLNAGQSYLFKADMGTLVESSNPAVMNTSAAIDMPGGCGDGASNQIPPESVLGTEYFLERGTGNDTAEQTTVVATKDNTTLTVEGYNANGTLASSKTVTLTQAGKFYTFVNGVPGVSFTASHISADKKVAVYSGTAQNCEVDISTIAPVSECGGSNFIETAKFRNYRGATLDYFGYILLRSATEPVTVNGKDITTIAGVGARYQIGSTGWYLINFNSKQIGGPDVLSIASKAKLTVSIVQQEGGFSMAGFFSSFAAQPEDPTMAYVSGGGCNNNTATLTTPSNFAPYQWYFNGVAITDANSDSYIATKTGSYSVASTLACGIQAQSKPVSVTLCTDLGVKNTVDFATPCVGSNVVFTVELSNLGVNNATGVSVNDLLPTGYSFVSSIQTVGSYDSGTGVWSIGDVNGGVKHTLKITAKVNASGIYTNKAWLPTTTADSNLHNNEASVLTTPNPLPTASLTGTLTACFTTTLTAVTNATSPAYVWYKNNVVISGQTSSTLVVNSDGDYKVKVTNSLTGCETTSAASTVKVSDTQKPTITCLAIVVVSADANLCTASGVALGTPTTSDNCSGTVTITNNAPLVFPIGNTTVTWTAKDAAGNTETCTQIVTVNDTEKPTITCPATVIVSADANLCTSSGVALGTPTTSDNCNGTVTLTNNAPLVFPIGDTTVTWTAKDVAGNTETCIQIVTVKDTQEPTITCPATVIVSADANLCTASGVLLGTPTTSDNCNGTVKVTNNAPLVFPIGDTTVTWTAEDAAGNTQTCTQTVRVNDTEKPTITCPAIVIVSADANLCTASGVLLGTPTTSDNCNGTVKVTNNAPLVFPIGDTTVTWTAEDAAGNTQTCTQTVRVNDTEKPTITCPAIVIVLADANLCTASGVLLGTPTTSDNCGSVTVTNDAPSVFPIGNTIVTWTVKDVAGNIETCTQTIQVVGPIIANEDKVGSFNGYEGGIAIADVLANDLLNCSAIVRGEIALTLDSTLPSVLTFDTTTGAVTVKSNTPVGTYSFDYKICEVSNSSNCNTTTVEIKVVAPTILAVKENLGPINGTIGGKTTSLIASDKLNGVQAVIGSAPGEVTLTGTAPAGLTINTTDGTVTVSAGVKAGSYDVAYTICDNNNPGTNCSTATSTVVVTAADLVANLDSVGSAVGGNTSQTLINVFENDTKNGTKLNPSDVKLTPGTDPKGYLTIDASGNAVLGANVPAGNYELTYEICEVLNPGNCSTNKVQVTVTAPAILAVKETLGPINGTIGGKTTSLIASDKLNNIQAVIGSNPGEVTLTGTAPAGLTINTTDGTVTISAGVKAGSYDVEYTICDNNNPGTNCSTATSTVVVTAADLVANLDSVGSAVGGSTSQTLINVFDNDTKNGTKLNPSDVKLTPGTDPKGYLTIDANGNAVLGANAPAGNYELTYEICEVLNPTNCATNKVEVTVTAPAILAVKETLGPINGTIGGTTTSLIASDKLNNIQAVIGSAPGEVTLTGIAPKGLSINTDGTVTVSAGVKAGSYDVEYTICDNNNVATNCSTATSTVVVTAADLVANLDSAGSVVGGNTSQTLINVFDNDTKNGTKLNPSDVKLTPGTDPKGYLTIDANGNAVLGANAPAGNYELTYEICEVLNPGNCSTNKVQVTVTAPAILAVKETLDPINGTIGGKTTSLITSDKLNNIQAVIGSNPGQVTLTGTAPAGLTINTTDGTVTVSAGVKAGSYDVAYTICDNNNPGTNCSTATSTVVVTAADLVANLDSAGSVVGGNTSQTLVNVFDNDTKNGTKLNPSDVKLTPGTDPKGYLTIDANGNAVLGANAPAGNYELTYEICEILNPTNCSSNKIEVTVTAPAILAVKETLDPINGTIGGKTTSLIASDKLNNIQAVIGSNPGEVTLTGTAPAGLTVNTDGTVTVSAGVKAGSYDVEYTICDNNNPGTNCSTATSTVVVTAADLVANLDSAGSVVGGNTSQTLINVFDNDTKNGAKLNPSDVKLTSGTDPKGYLTIDANGNAVLGANAPAGNYELTYEICEVLNPGNCSTNKVQVTVTAPAILAVKETLGPINGTIGGKTTSLIASDKLNGVQAVIGSNPGEVTLTGTAPAGLTINTTDGTVTVSAGVKAGSYNVEYTICDNTNPGTNCSTATSTVVVTAADLVANLDSVGSAVGGNTSQTLINVFDNDTKNGAKLNPSDVKLTPGTDPKGYLTIDANGNAVLGANAPAGNYELTYEICEILNPANCSSNKIEVTVKPSVLQANDDNAGTLDSSKGQSSTTSIFDNDTLNGSKVNPADLVLTTLIPNPNLILKADGTVEVKPGTPTGNYELTYQICEALNGSNCSQAVVKISVVNNPPITPLIQLIINNDGVVSVDGINGALEFINVLDNDLIKGLPVNPLEIVLSNTPSPYFEFNSDGTVNVKPNTPGGSYSLTYQVCEKSNPNNCASAILSVFVEVPSIAIIKTAVFNDENGSGFANAGETITYKFKVTNTGNVPLTGVMISDPLPGVVVSGQAINLNVNESDEHNFTATYKITQSDINKGSVSNQASVQARSAKGVLVDDLSDDENETGDKPTVLALNGCEIKVFNAFSPNGDDINSKFYIRGLECYPDNTVEIYNRWGILVYNIDKYNNDDRAFKGFSEGRTTIKQSEGLPVGTYFYILKYKDSGSNPHELSGYLYINK